MSDRRFENHPALRAARVGPSRGGAQGSESASTIRDLTVAAPLKHHIYIRAQKNPTSYPRPDGRGPIEAGRAAAATVKGCAIRDLTVAAPLKHRIVRDVPSGLGRLSAT